MDVMLCCWQRRKESVLEVSMGGTYCYSEVRSLELLAVFPSRESPPLHILYLSLTTQNV